MDLVQARVMDCAAELTGAEGGGISVDSESLDETKLDADKVRSMQKAWVPPINTRRGVEQEIVRGTDSVDEARRQLRSYLARAAFSD